VQERRSEEQNGYGEQKLFHYLCKDKQLSDPN